MSTRPARARALAVLRIYGNMSQRDLAQLSGVNKVTISGYERGKLAIGADNLDALLQALSLSDRAWEATVRHVQWIDHLRAAQAGGVDTGTGQAFLLAEMIAREIERGVSAVLREVAVPAGERAGEEYPVEDEKL